MKTKNEKNVNSSKEFYEKLDKCQVIYKIQNSEVQPKNQRATVAGYKKDGNYYIGIAIRSFKDIMDKKKAKVVACRRSLFTPTIVLPVLNEEDSIKELHFILRNVKEQYDVFALYNNFIKVVSVVQ